MPEVGLSAKLCSLTESIAVVSLEDLKSMAQHFGMKEWSFLGKATLDNQLFNAWYVQDGSPPPYLEKLEWHSHFLAQAPHAPESARKVSSGMATDHTIDFHATSADACGCLNWKDVYNFRVECTAGAGYEFFNDTLSNQTNNITRNESLSMDWLIFNRCPNAFELIDDNFCVNQEFVSQKSQTWCWVSSACTELGGGKYVPEVDLSAKLCGADITRPAFSEIKGMAHRFHAPGWMPLAYQTMTMEDYGAALGEESKTVDISTMRNWSPVPHAQEIQDKFPRGIW